METAHVAGLSTNFATLLLPASTSIFNLLVLSMFWGVAMMIIGLGMQVKVLALAALIWSVLIFRRWPAALEEQPNQN